MPAVSVQFALILEAYCRCNIPHIEVLKKQVGHTHTHIYIYYLKHTHPRDNFFIFVSRDHVPQFHSSASVFKSTTLSYGARIATVYCQS